MKKPVQFIISAVLIVYPIKACVHAVISL